MQSSFPSSVTTMNPDGVRAGMRDGGPDGPIRHERSDRRPQEDDQPELRSLPGVAFVPTLSTRQRELLDSSLAMANRG